MVQWRKPKVSATGPLKKVVSDTRELLDKLRERAKDMEKEAEAMRKNA